MYIYLNLFPLAKNHFFFLEFSPSVVESVLCIPIHIEASRYLRHEYLVRYLLRYLPFEYLKYLNKFSNNWQKTCFRWLFCIFNMKPEVDLSNLYFLLITTIELENLPLKILKCLNNFSIYWRKTCFRRPFWIFLTKQEVDFQNQGVCALIEVQPEHTPLEFWKKILISLGAMVVKNTDRQTDRQTYRHTYMHTYIHTYINRQIHTYIQAWIHS